MDIMMSVLEADAEPAGGDREGIEIEWRSVSLALEEGAECRRWGEGGDVVMIVKVAVVGEKGGPGDRCTVACFGCLF
jgi:hypothetical protein